MPKNNWTLIASCAALACLFVFGCSSKQTHDPVMGLSGRADGAIEIRDARTSMAIGTSLAIDVWETFKYYCEVKFIEPESCAKTLPTMKRMAEIASHTVQFLKEHPDLINVRAEAMTLVDGLMHEVADLGIKSTTTNGTLEFRSSKHDLSYEHDFMQMVSICEGSLHVARSGLDSALTEVPPPAPILMRFPPRWMCGPRLCVKEPGFLRTRYD